MVCLIGIDNVTKIRLSNSKRHAKFLQEKERNKKKQWNEIIVFDIVRLICSLDGIARQHHSEGRNDLWNDGGFLSAAAI